MASGNGLCHGTRRVRSRENSVASRTFRAAPRERAGVGELEGESRVTAWQLARDELAQVLGTGARVEERVAHEGDEVVELGGGEGDRVGELRVEGGEQRCGRTDRPGEITR